MGNPNPAKRFPPGYAGPGRPKGSVSLKDSLKKIMDMEININEYKELEGLLPETQKNRKVKVGHLLNARIAALALKGKDWAAKEVWDRMEGTAKQNIEQVIRVGKHEEFSGMTDEEVLEKVKNL